MFFSEVDREQAILDIIERWGSWGVRTEPLAEERTVHSMRGWFWKKHFDRKQFRRKFQKLSHEDRLNAIEELNAKGIDFKFTDPTSDECYQSHWSNYGAVRNSRCFSYDFDLGYLPEDGSPFELPENFPSVEERRKEIDEVERTLLHLIAKHGGFVTRIERNVYDEAVSLEESENFLGSGHIHARFPDNQSRREASREIHERLAVASVSFPVEDGEELSIDEQIAVAHDELAEELKELDYASSNLDYRKQRHREEGPAIEEAEQRLREKEIEFKELEKKIAERVKALSLCREGLSELETQGEERMDDV
jgi:hypothetical protein